MANADISLTAELDAHAVDASLNQIIKRTGQMKKSADENMKAVGASMNVVSMALKDQLEGYKALEKAGKLDEESSKSFKALREDIMGSVEALDALVARLNQAAKITVDFDTGPQQVTRKQIRGKAESSVGVVRGQRFEKELEAMLETSEGRVKKTAQAILADLQAIFNDPTIEGSKFNKEIGNLIDKMKRLQKETKTAEQQARDLVDIGGVSRTESRETRAFEDVEQDAQDFHDKLTGIMSRTEGTVRDRAGTIREDLSEMMDDPKIKADQYAKELSDLEKELDNVIKKEQERERINIEPGATGLGGRRKDVQQQIGKDIAGIQGEQLEQQLKRLMGSSREIVARDAAAMQADLESIFQIDYADADRLLKNVAELQQKANQLEKAKPLDLATAEEVAQMSDLRTAMSELATASQQAAEGASQEGKDLIKDRQEVADIISKEAELRKSATNKDIAAVKKTTTAVKALGKAHKEPTEAAEELADAVEEVVEAVDQLEPINKKLDAQKATNTFKSNSKDIDALLKSNKTEVKLIARELDRMGKEAKEAFDKGETEAEDFLKVQNRVRGAVRQTADAFDEDLPSAQKRATVSSWQLGNAMDRIGVRGAGGASRIVGAFHGIPPAAIAGVLAVAALTAVTVKLIEAMVKLGAMAAKAFAQFVKGAVEAARNVEITDRQLGSLINNPDLGKGFRNLLLDKSFEVGLDLTGDFSRVIVPLTKDLDEVERAADIAATLAHAFQETDEAIANAIKQAAGGHFRPLIERFGLTEFEIGTIQDAQEKLGAFTGVLEGLDAALDRRGLDIDDTFGGTLQKLLGQLGVLKQQIDITVGEPVRDDLAVQLEGLFDLVEGRKDSLIGFFETLGESVGTVVESIGELVRGLIGDVSDADIENLEDETTRLGDAVADAIDNLRELLTTDDKSVVEVMVDLTDVLADVSEQLAEILQIWEGIANIQRGITDFNIPGVGTVGELVKPDLGSTFGDAAFVKTGLDVIGLIGKAFSSEGLKGEEAIETLTRAAARHVPILNLMTDEMVDLVVASEELDDANDDLAESTSGVTEADKAAIAAAHEREARIRALLELQTEAEAAQERIDDAEAKLARDRTMREAQIHTRFDRQEIDQDIRRSEQREDLFKKHMNSMLKLTDDLNFKISESGIKFDQKEVDLGTKHADKLADIDRKNADKKIDIEKKFRDKLKDIRAKFDLDAEEAIRRNDAVGLLRIRRRMQLELEQARTQRDRQVEEADDSAEKAREDAKIQLERGIRDNDLAEKRKLEDIMRADEQRRAQLIDQYNYEHAQIDVQYRRRRAAIEENERRAMTDLETSFEARREDLDKALEQDYLTVEKWKNAETEFIRLNIKAQEQLLRDQYQMWLREGSLMRHLLGWGSTGTTTVEPSGVSDRGEEIDEGSGGASVNADVDDPVGSGFRKQHGGYVVPGNVYGINERGTEAFYSTRAGIIQSRASLLESPFMTRNANVNIDNSRMIQADINTTDPTHMSPIQRTMIKQMLTEEMLSHGV